ncbi:hypothetical protein K488DRAFT_92759 [Vararia minispora EC-137]|uniref:Uncharacterized protein n=1 Tax=Vararia minispora EC-137 TaxID=1314806 RepID=A0ACB8Q444_9AGAM|nr:hypothetical protein K488DRAFT_92759 [Vararia minispora EC-137]
MSSCRTSSLPSSLPPASSHTPSQNSPPDVFLCNPLPSATSDLTSLAVRPSWRQSTAPSTKTVLRRQLQCAALPSKFPLALYGPRPVSLSCKNATERESLPSLPFPTSLDPHRVFIAALVYLPVPSLGLHFPPRPSLRSAPLPTVPVQPPLSSLPSNVVPLPTPSCPSRPEAENKPHIVSAPSSPLPEPCPIK